MAGSRRPTKKVMYLPAVTFWQTVLLMRTTASSTEPSAQCPRTAARSTVMSSAAPVPLPETSPSAKSSRPSWTAKS